MILGRLVFYMLKLTVISTAVSITMGGLVMLALKLGKSEWVALIVGGILILCGVVAFRFEKRRKQRQLESMRDSALW